MKRDWALIRQILLTAEALPRINTCVMPENIEGYEKDLVAYHMSLMLDAGLVEGPRQKTQTSIRIQVNSLTWEGHEFLDAIRRETVWNKIKGKFSQSSTDLPFKVVESLAIQFINQNIG